MSNPAAAIQLATVDFAVDREGEVSFEGSLVMATEGDSGFEIFDLEACFDEPPTASFTWRPGTPEAGQSVQLTDASFGTVDTRTWDFGDGGTSSERFPTHVWTAAGEYQVTLTVSGALGSGSTSRTVSVIPPSGDAPPITEPGDHVYVVAAAAHAPGLAGTSWVTDMVLHNPGATDAHTYLWFMKASQDNTAAEGVGIPVAAGTSVAVDDLVSTLFGEEDAVGAVLVGSDRPLRVTSRTYNDAAAGTFGQFIPGRELGKAVSAGDSAWLVELTRSPDFRTNLGVANPTAASVEVHVSLRRADGSEVDTSDLTVPPFGSLQRTDIFGTDVDDAVAVVSSATPGAAYFPYASVVDNRTGDPIMVQPIQPDDLQVIAAAAHVGGLENTEWRTDLEVCNPLAAAVGHLQIRMLGQRAEQQRPAVGARDSRRRHLQPPRRRPPDPRLLHQGTAALEGRLRRGRGHRLQPHLQHHRRRDLRTARARHPDRRRHCGRPRSATVTQLTQDVDDAAGFRTNLGFVNRSPVAITVDVALHSASGADLGDLAVQLLPFEHRQLNRVFRRVTSAPVADGHVTVSTSTAGGSFVAYASVVDNTSGDPVYIPAEPVGD